MENEIAEQIYQELNSAPETEIKRTITIRGKTVEIVEKYMKGRTYSETAARLIEMADRFYTEFARSKRQGGQ